MLDTTYSTYQRSRGAAHVALGSDGRIERLFQSGSAKAMIPKTHGPFPEVVFLNTSGGLTGGDQLSFALDVADGTTAMASTQTAERAYASPGGTPAGVQVDLYVGAGAMLFWLPQETILFDRASLNRHTTVQLGQGARFLGIETLVLGRGHMGETVERLDFTDMRRVSDLDGRPLHAEQISIDDAALKMSSEPVTFDGATVMSTIVFMAEVAADRLDAVRSCLSNTTEKAAASAWGNRLVVRAMGDDAWTLRAALIPALKHLTGGTLPRVWQT